MSPDETPPSKPPPAATITKEQDQNQGSSNKKGSSTRPQEQGLKCPRCDSPNTKFCYYNNYSLTQPRHFCKTCRRYWTKGGALRNVPIGGGCRKNKKVKSSRLSCDSKDSGSSSSDLGGLKFLHGLSPSMDFHLGGLPFPRFHHHHHHPPTTSIYNNQFASFGDTSTTASSCFNLDPSSSVTSNPLAAAAAMSYPFSYNGAIEGVSSMNLASSIESLSSMNQDLHLKLQQQRLAMLFGGDNNKDSVAVSSTVNQLEKPQPILFQNLEISKPGFLPVGGSRKEHGPSGDTVPPTEWFFGNSFASVTPTPTTSGGGGGPVSDNASNWNSGVHAWGDVQQQYSALP
ncbi:hypothetical protein RJT34_06444 [Clitoria ternatea]|uniref:Dof zinc finger protein n=1 Tax=Clitoria ternatea TaxID=43366 RepID=A0AAN9PT32_CLITE